MSFAPKSNEWGFGEAMCPKCRKYVVTETSNFPILPVLAIATIVASLSLILLGFWLWRSNIGTKTGEIIESFASATHSSAVKNDLRKIGIALLTHASQDPRGFMLPSDEATSWRINLAKTTHLYEPNQLCENGRTSLLLITGPGTFFDKTNPTAGTIKYLEKCSRAASTIPLVINAGKNVAVNIDDQSDFVFNPADPKSGLGNLDEHFLVLMADGSVHEFPADISERAFQVLCQVYPTLDEIEFGRIAPELKSLGLPSKLPVNRFQSKPAFE